MGTARLTGALSMIVAMANSERGAVLFLGLQLLQVLLDNNVQCGMQKVGLRIKSSLTLSIFRKVIILRQDGMMNFSTGKLNNLITTDVDKSTRVVRFIHVLLVAPLQVVIALASLYQLMGPAIFIGLGWMVTCS